MTLIPQLGMLEILVLAALALVVVGPKELPRLMYGIGKFVSQAKALANEFKAGFDQMAREAEIDEMRKEIAELKKLNPVDEIKDAVDDAISPLTREKDKGVERKIDPMFDDSDHHSSEMTPLKSVPPKKGSTHEH